MNEENDECPGCRSCGDTCDVWDGRHMWISMFKNPDRTGPYDECDFCGKKVEKDA